MRHKRVPVIYKSLRRNWGNADIDKRLIEIDKQCKGLKHLEIIVHELTHILHPNADEKEVERISITITRTLWHEGYRRIDSDESQHLQDGNKL